MTLTNCYLSNSDDLPYVLEMTELSPDELELLVGRFRSYSMRAGQLRGEFVQYVDGTCVIRHHFTKKVLWRSDNTNENHSQLGGY